jgi:uncharacterized protein
MPTRKNHVVAGVPIWVDLSTSDAEGTREFYGQVLGWEALEAQEQFGGYFNFTKDGELVAGCMPKMADNPMPDAWMVYLTSTDARQTIQDAEAKGATTIVPAMDVADLGTMGVLSDPSGAAIGLWEPKAHRGFGLYGVLGTPAWFDLQTSDYEAAIDFYRSVFRWSTETLSDAPDMRYTTLKVGDEQLAGIMDAKATLGQDEPSNWKVVFMVEDTDKSLEQVVGLGGSVSAPAMDSPYGRMAVVKDPYGASFALIDGNRTP